METLLNLLPTIVFFLALSSTTAVLYDIIIKMVNFIIHKKSSDMQLLYPIVAVFLWSWLFYLLH